MIVNLDFGLCAEYSVQVLRKDEIESMGEMPHYAAVDFDRTPHESDPVLLIKHPSSVPWLCTLSGLNEKPNVQGIYACPSPKHFLAVVDNMAYYVCSSTQGDVKIAGHLVESVEVSLPHSLLLLVLSQHIIAYGKDGLLWKSPELMLDGIYITHITEDLIWGHGDEFDGDYGEFKISTKDGSIVQHNWFTEDYYEDTVGLPTNSIYENIYRRSFSTHNLSGEDHFLLFYLLHNYSIELKSPGLVSDAPTKTRLRPLTQRGCSSILSLLWMDAYPVAPKKSEEATESHWYWKWNSDWNGELRTGNLSAGEQKRLHELIDVLLQNELVAKVEIDEEV